MPTIFEKIYGIEATAAIANSMGDVTEGLTYKEIESRYGFVDRLLPQEIKGGKSQPEWGAEWVRHPHYRPPGATEDGM